MGACTSFANATGLSKKGAGTSAPSLSVTVINGAKLSPMPDVEPVAEQQLARPSQTRAMSPADAGGRGGAGRPRRINVGPLSSYAQEDKIELIFKGKRGNVFASGITADEREGFQEKLIPKTEVEKKKIRTALDQNFVFASLDDGGKLRLSDAMEKVTVKQEENLISQGDTGDYFYIIETGKFAVIVSGNMVAELEEGRSFGELALMFNSPRAATIRALCPSVVYALDRATFRLVLANSQTMKSVAISEALNKVPLLTGLTEPQVAKITDIVELLPFPAGDAIIKKGTEGNVFYMIKEGTLKVTDIGDGRTYPDITLGPGEYFGERALITGEPRAANVTAMTNVVLMALDRVSFNSLLGPLKEVLNQNMVLRVLNSIRWFDTVNARGKVLIAKSFVSEVFAEGATVVKEGVKASKFFILNDGQAKIISLVHSVKVGTNEAPPSTGLLSGMYFGELSLIDDEPNRSTIVVVKDSEFFTLTREAFDKVMQSIQNAIPTRNSSMMFGKDALELAEPPKTYKFGDLEHVAILGSGTFGRVTLVKEKTSRQIYALKTMLKTEIVAHKQQNNVLNEKNIMMSCHHPFILRLYQTFKDARKLYMLIEFVQGGELFGVVHTARSDGVPDSQAKFYAAGIILALGYLHKKDIAYRDLKPENCLIDAAGYPKLIDFGFAKVLTGSSKTYTLCGTPEYLAPEQVIESEGHTCAVDYWAFGILLYEMVSGVSPFAIGEDTPHSILFDNIVRGKVQHPLSDYTDNTLCADLVSKLLVREPLKRLGNVLSRGVDDVIDHPFFESIDFDQFMRKKTTAPWVPKVTSIVDTSHFDIEGVEDHPDFDDDDDEEEEDKEEENSPLSTNTTASVSSVDPTGTNSARISWDADF